MDEKTQKRNNQIALISFIQTHFVKPDGYRPKKYDPNGFAELVGAVIEDLHLTVGKESTRLAITRVVGR